MLEVYGMISDFIQLSRTVTLKVFLHDDIYHNHSCSNKHSITDDLGRDLNSQVHLPSGTQ
jgi:hypothetical protein